MTEYLGLLGGLADPEYLQELKRRDEARDYAVQRIAEVWSVTPATARAWLDHDDESAMKVFEVGNKFPRELLH